MKKVAIIIGHRSEAQGAYSPFLEQTEFQFNSDIAEQLSDVADIFYRPNIKGVGEITRIKNMVSEINKNDYELVISLHFNSSVNDTANGCEALYYYSNAMGEVLALYFVNKMSERIGIKKRRLIPIISKEQRGHAVVAGCKATTILLEPFFGSNEEDCALMSNCKSTYVQIIRELINQVL